MENRFMLVRHGYDNHSYIDGKNDTSLTERGINDAKEAAKKLIYEVESDDIIIRHSTRKRAKETAEIFCDYFLKKGFNCKTISDYGLTELQQGKLDFGEMPHDERVTFLESCWQDFEKCRMNGDLSHHFGQNKDRGIVVTPGENHIEWSLRIADGLLNIISDIENSYQSINIAHRGAIYEIEQLVKFSNGIIGLDDVEKYNTRWMAYCSDYTLELNDLDQAKTLIKKYKSVRGQNENNN